MNKSNWVFSLVVTLNWFNPTTSFLMAILSMLIFDFPLTPGVMLSYMKIFVSLLKGMAAVPGAFQFFIELKVSLKRLNYFIDSMEIDQSYAHRLAADDSISPFAIELDCGSFYWN